MSGTLDVEAREPRTVVEVEMEVPVAPRALGGPIAVLVMALAGLGISAYLTAVHYAGVPLACTAGSVVDCSAVTTSSYSVVPGTSVPVTVPGLLWFAVSAGLALVALRAELEGAPASSRLAAAAVLWSAAGLVGVLYLVWAEAARLHRLCEWCTAAHLLVAASLVVGLVRLQRVTLADRVTAADREG